MRTDDFHEVQYSRMLLGLGTFIAVGVAIAVGGVFGPTARLLVGLALLVVLAVAAYRTRLVVTINSEGVRVSEAHLEWRSIGRAEALDLPAMRAALTTAAHPNDYLRVRNTDAGLRLWLNDASDPHRCWVVSVRDLAGLRRSLDACAPAGHAHAS